MGLSFSQERVFERSPAVLWNEIVRAPRSNWPLGLGGVPPEPGQAIFFQLHVEGLPASEATGRILQVKPGSRLVLQQESPWQSHLVLTLTPLENGCATRARLITTLEKDGIDWFFPWQSADDTTQQKDDVALGLLTSLSGVSGIFGRGVINAATLAVEEVNSLGGAAGRRLRLVVSDDSTTTSALGGYQELTRRHGCQTVLGMVPSPSVERIRRIADREKRLFLHTPLNEGGVARGMVYQFGPRPHDQLSQSIPYLMRETGERDWFITGNDFSWPRAIQRAATRIIEREGGRVVGAAHTALPDTSFESTLTRIKESQAGLVLSSFAGAAEAQFEVAMHSAGLRSQSTTLATLLDGTTLQYIPPAARDGIFTTIDDFDMSVQADSSDLRARWVQRFGPLSPPLSALARSVYDSVHLYARAATKARTNDPVAVARTLKEVGLGKSVMLARAAGERIPSSIVRLGPEEQTLVAM